MSLFSSIRQANNTLNATQIGLQVVGQNIANASTPGYSREEVILTPAPTQRLGGLLLGLGVQVKGVVQKVDKFLDERLRGAVSDRVGAEVREQAYLTLEGLVGELSDTDLSSSLNRFFASVTEVANQPEDVSIRELAIRQGETLAQDIRRLATRVVQQRSNLDGQVVRAVDDINRLTEEVRTLNLRISSVEGGDVSASDAVGLRDQRHLALTKLAELIGIRVTEQASGAVNVYIDGEYLVFDGERREIEVTLAPSLGLNVAEIRLAENDLKLEPEGGEVGGLIAARDEILAGFHSDLDAFAAVLANEFNKVHASGQGLTGYAKVTAEYAAASADEPLDEAGLPFVPAGGAFQVLTLDRQTGLTATTAIQVDLNGLDGDTTLSDLALAVDAIDGISASVSTAGFLTIEADSASVEFSFGNDSSGVLAALGINAFFTGTSALTLGVDTDLLDHPARFAASRGGMGHDNENAVELAGLLDRPIESAGGGSLMLMYDRIVGKTTQASTVAQSVAEGLRVFQETLDGQRLATSGVNLDEEAVKMLTLQRQYQAAARYIASVAELLEILVSI